MQEVTAEVWIGDNADKQSTKATTDISLAGAWLAIAAIAAYHLLLTALIFIRPDLDPYWHTISEYAIGPYGWIMWIAFSTAAVSYGSLAVAIRSQLSGVFGKLGLGILIICTVGLFGVGLFATDPLDTRPESMTTPGILHLVSGASQLVLLPFAALLINLNLTRRNQEWKTARLPLRLTAALPLIGLIGFIVHFTVYLAPLGENAYGPDVPIGWPPRLLFFSYMVWLITLAWQAIQVRGQWAVTARTCSCFDHSKL